MSISTSLASAIRNKNSNYIAEIAIAMHNNDAWNGETPRIVRDLINSRRHPNQYRFTGTFKQIREILNQYFAPYLEHFPETYRRVADVINRLPRIIRHIKDLQNNARQQELARLEAEKAALEERIARLKELSPDVPITPPPPQPLPRYEGSQAQAIDQILTDMERSYEQEQNLSPTIIPDDMTPEEYGQMEENMAKAAEMLAKLRGDANREEQSRIARLWSSSIDDAIEEYKDYGTISPLSHTEEGELIMNDEARAKIAEMIAKYRSNKQLDEMKLWLDVIDESMDELQKYNQLIPKPPRTPPKPVPLKPYRTEYDEEIDKLIRLVEDNEPIGSDRRYDSIADLMNALNRTPFGTRININNFTEEQLPILCKYLNDWFEKHIEPHINNNMLIAYEIDGEPRVLHTVQKDLNRIKEMFTNNQLFKIDKAYDTANAYDETIYLNMFDRIYFLDFSKAVNRPAKYRQVHGDGFFPRKLCSNYKLLEPYLERYQVYATYVDANNKTKSTVNVPCFTYALQMAGISQETTDKILALMSFQKRINRKQWTDICKQFNLRIHLRIINEKGEIDNANHNNKGWFGPEDGTQIHLAEYLNHIFIDEPLPITRFAINHWNDIYNLHTDISYLLKTYKLKNGKPSIDSKRANIRSLDAIVAIDRAGGFESINATDEDVITANVFGYEIKEPEPIACPYSEKAHTRTIEPDKRNNKEIEVHYPIFYADFETCKQSIDNIKGVNAKAVPFMLCITSQSGKWERTYIGFDCMDQMMNEITARVKSHAVIYFHNLGFDGNFLMKYADKQMIKKGNKIMRIPLIHNNKTIELRDSYSLFPKKLSAFPSSFPAAFKGTDIQKEFFPYDYYTYDRIEQCLEYEEYQEWMCELEDPPTKYAGNLIECVKECHISNEDKKVFVHNLVSTGSVINAKEKTFDMLKYCQFYCLQDIRVLRTGFEAFAKATAADPINLNVHNFLTLPSLADYYMKKNVFYPNGNIKELNGPVQKFIQQAVYGGRCMTAHNKRHFITTPLYDFDARSLYPSAMRRMFTVEGAPEYYTNPSPDTIFNAHNLPDILMHAFNENQKTPTQEKYISQFFVEIDITNVGIHRAFPLIVKREQNKQTNCNECVKMVVDMITLQDLITFQDISFKLGNGYIMKGNRDYRVQKVIQKLYDLRNEYKKTGNPTQEVIKLIMNSAYGKSIQKPIKSFLQFVKKEAFDWFVKDRYHQIHEITQIDDETYLFELNKQKSLQFNNCVFGVTVLSMSKRIMNEVMCLAEDEGINIYYQDTDSMHIEADKLSQLAEAFKNKYNRELIGDDMGQFHDDFDELSNNPRAIVHISAGKKMYYDLLINDKGETAEHYRLKGIPQQCIKNTAAKLFGSGVAGDTANKRFNGSVQALYEALYNAESIEFDLLDGKVCMVMDKSGNVHYKSKFSREVKATSEL